MSEELKFRAIDFLQKGSVGEQLEEKEMLDLIAAIPKLVQEISKVKKATLEQALEIHLKIHREDYASKFCFECQELKSEIASLQ